MVKRVESPGSRVESRQQVLAILESVKDPEVPVLSVVELGIVRDVELDGDAVTVVVTPTYSGCPAMHEIEEDIVSKLRECGIRNVKIRTVYAPAWTTDWIGEAAKEKLRAYGISPPGHVSVETTTALVTLERRRAAVRCPFCGSVDTRLSAEFGATACKALHVCNACTQPFEEFKAF